MSIVLDTNVVSEIRKQDVDARVLGWLRAQDPRQLFVTATTVGELAAGAAVLPQGRRRREIEAWLRELVETKFAGRVLSYDAATAMLYGDFFAAVKARGRRPVLSDVQIAAVTAHHGMTLATRNVRDFEALRLMIIDPWLHKQPMTRDEAGGERR